MDGAFGIRFNVVKMIRPVLTECKVNSCYNQCHQAEEYNALVFSDRQVVTATRLYTYQ